MKQNAYFYVVAFSPQNCPKIDLVHFFSNPTLSTITLYGRIIGLHITMSQVISNLLDGVTLGGAYVRSRAFPVGLHGHVIDCSGR